MSGGEANSADLLDGSVQIQWRRVADGELRLTAKKNGDVLESAVYGKKIFGSTQLRGEFVNSTLDSLGDDNGTDPDALRDELQSWFAEMNEQLAEESEAVYELLNPEVKRIIDGTESVAIRGAEDTTWHVTLTYEGRTRELEFTAPEMISPGPTPLEEKIANQFYQIVEIGEEGWNAIVQEWQEQATVEIEIEETAAGSIADRVLSALSREIRPVAKREDMGNDVVAAWADPENQGAHPAIDGAVPIVWVQADALTDALERAGKQVSYLGQLVKELISRGDLLAGRARKKWAWEKRAALYPFDPEAVGVDVEDVGPSDESNHAGVEA